MRKLELFFVGLVVLAGMGYSTISQVDMLWAEEGHYPAEGYKKSGRNYIWKQSIEESTDGLQSAEFDAVNGNVLVSPQEGKNTVEVQAEIRIKRSFFVSENTVLNAKESIGVRVERKDGRLVVRADQPKISSWKLSITISLTVRIPPTLATHAESVNGTVGAKGIQAPLEVKSVNGLVIAENCLGPVRAESVNGTIQLGRISNIQKASTVNGAIVAEIQNALQNDCSFETVNGSVKVDIPDQSSARLELGNVNGSIGLRVSSFQGERKKHNVNGTVNGGGARLSVHTVNGAIEVY